jgi:hypothetical protein
MDTVITLFDLKVRYQVYHFFAENCRAPAYQEIADLLSEEKENVRVSFHKLHERHMFFLEPGTDTIRIANPFSAIPTNFRVTSGEKAWWANCAWDSVGIAAALKNNVHIETSFHDTKETTEMRVEHGEVDKKHFIVYFPLPYRHWYDDLIYT